MKFRLIGPAGWGVAFAVVAALVVGGLGWVTLASLRVEAAQLEATARADRANQERVALWRLDGYMLPALGLENNRPFGHYSTLSNGHKSWRGWVEWYASIATVALRGWISPTRKVSAYRIQKLHDPAPRIEATGGGPRQPEWFGEDLLELLGLLREGRIHPVVAERLPFADARRAHELLEETASVGKLVLVP